MGPRVRYLEIFMNGLVEGLKMSIHQEVAKMSTETGSKPRTPRRKARKWSFWFLETKESFAWVAIPGDIKKFIPEDGSFQRAHCVETGLTEDQAKERVEMVKKAHKSKKPMKPRKIEYKD